MQLESDETDITLITSPSPAVQRFSGKHAGVHTRSVESHAVRRSGIVSDPTINAPGSKMSATLRKTGRKIHLRLQKLEYYVCP